MVAFDNWKFREILKRIVERGELNGEMVRNKRELYEKIGYALNFSPDTVKFWEREKSNGPDPGKPEYLEKLGEFLGLPTGALLKQISMEEEKTEEKRMARLSDFQKQQIMEIYEALKSLVSEMKLGDEDEYYRIRWGIERKKMILPDNLFKEIMQFVDDVVEEYVYDAEEPVFTEEEAEYDENGVMNIKTDAGLKKLMIKFLENLQELDEKIDQFAEERLRPYLLG